MCPPFLIAPPCSSETGRPAGMSGSRHQPLDDGVPAVAADRPAGGAAGPSQELPGTAAATGPSDQLPGASAAAGVRSAAAAALATGVRRGVDQCAAVWSRWVT